MDALSATQLAQANLAELSEYLRQLDQPGQMKRWFDLCRCHYFDGWYRIWNHPDDPLTITHRTVEPREPWYWNALGGRELDMLEFLKQTESLRERLDVPLPELMQQVYEQTTVDRTLGANYRVTRGFFKTLPGMMMVKLQRLAEVRTAIISLRVERYRLMEGKLPERIEDVAELRASLSSVDPFDGNTLRYQLLPRGYTIYSVARRRLRTGKALLAKLCLWSGGDALTSSRVML